MYSPGHILCTVYCFTVLSDFARRYTACTVCILGKSGLEPHQYREYGILAEIADTLSDGTQYVPIIYIAIAGGILKGTGGHRHHLPHRLKKPRGLDT